MERAPTRRLLVFWTLLLTLSLGLVFLLLFATLEPRPLDAEALRYFPAEMLERGRRFSQEAQVAGSLRYVANVGLLLALCFHPRGVRWLTGLEGLGRGRFWLALTAVGAGVSLLTALVELPFAFYLGYVHEHAYGLSRLTAAQWLGDHAIDVLLDTAVSLLLWLPLYALIRRFPRGWWLPASLLSAAFGALLALIHPLVFLPLSGELADVTDPQVLGMVERLADRAGVEVEQVRELRVSEKSSRLNALVTGLGPTKQVVLYNTLLDRMTPAEVEVVLAHELAHAAYGDILRGWALQAAIGTLGFALAAWLLQEMRHVVPLSLPAPHAARGLALLILFLSLFDTVTGPIHQAASRQMEVRADAFALAVTQNPRAMVSSFQKLAHANPRDVSPPDLVVWLSHSHPPILDRIRRALAAQPKEP